MTPKPPYTILAHYYDDLIGEHLKSFKQARRVLLRAVLEEVRVFGAGVVRRRVRSHPTLGRLRHHPWSPLDSAGLPDILSRPQDRLD